MEVERGEEVCGIESGAPSWLWNPRGNRTGGRGTARCKVVRDDEIARSESNRQGEEFE